MIFAVIFQDSKLIIHLFLFYVVANMAMMALMAAENGINVDTYRHWAMCQMHYSLGDTGFSYVVGFGDHYPTRAHHRGA